MKNVMKVKRNKKKNNDYDKTHFHEAMDVRRTKLILSQLLGGSRNSCSYEPSVCSSTPP